MKDSASISVGKPRETLEAWEFDVAVGKRQHTVTVQKSYWRELTEGRITPQQLVFQSFLFLLEREPAESILSQFDISEIRAYFPEYEKVARGWSGV